MTNYYIIGTFVGIILLLVIAIWLLLRFLKKRKQKKLLIDAKTGFPLDVLSDFNEAERRIKENREEDKDAQGNISPQRIMWNMAIERNNNLNKNREVLNNGNSYRIEENTGERSGSSSTGTTIQSSPGTAGTTSDSQSANGNLQRDREPEQGRSVQIQSDIGNTKDKRNTKRNWAKFD
jgi:hypothetical protein